MLDRELEVFMLVFGMNMKIQREFIKSLDAKKSREIIVASELAINGTLNGYLRFFKANVSQFSGERPEDELSIAAEEHLLKVAAWINEKMSIIANRDSTIHAAIDIRFWDGSHEFSLILPPEFLIACGKADMKIVFSANVAD